jgi:hypothetical protein
MQHTVHQPRTADPRDHLSSLRLLCLQSSMLSCIQASYASRSLATEVEGMLFRWASAVER